MANRNEPQNPWRVWDPPVFPKAPVSSSTHSILPLKQFLCSQKFIGTLESNQIINGKTDASTYQHILSSINLLIKKPMLYYTLLKCCLTFISFVASVIVIISLIFLEFIWFGVSLGIVLATFVCIRESGNKYFKSMGKIKNAVNELLGRLQREYLEGTNVKLFCGDYCAWIDFTTEEQEVIEESPAKMFHVFTPGCVESKGTVSLPLL